MTDKPMGKRKYLHRKHPDGKGTSVRYYIQTFAVSFYEKLLELRHVIQKQRKKSFMDFPVQLPERDQRERDEALMLRTEQWRISRAAWSVRRTSQKLLGEDLKSILLGCIKYEDTSFKLPQGSSPALSFSFLFFIFKGM